jgi:hypothetical protein
MADQLDPINAALSDRYRIERAPGHRAAVRLRRGESDQRLHTWLTRNAGSFPAW